eukprot:6492230-Amphidinium_carterae.1
MDIKSMWLCSFSEHEKVHGVDPRSKHVDINSKAESFCRDLNADAGLGAGSVDAAVGLLKCAPHQIVCPTTQFSSNERKQLQFWRHVYALEDSVAFYSLLVVEVLKLPEPVPLHLPGHEHHSRTFFRRPPPQLTVPSLDSTRVPLCQAVALLMLTRNFHRSRKQPNKTNFTLLHVAFCVLFAVYCLCGMFLLVFLGLSCAKLCVKIVHQHRKQTNKNQKCESRGNLPTEVERAFRNAVGEEVQESANIALHLPVALVQLVLSCRWKHILLPNSSGEKRLKIGWTLLKKCLGVQHECFHNELARIVTEESLALQVQPFGPHLAAGLGDTLRALLHQVAVPDPDLHARAAAYISILDRTDWQLQPKLVPSSQDGKMERLLKALMIAECLSADSHLKDVLAMACRYLLSPQLAEVYVRELKNPSSKPPSKHELSRARCTVDVGLMLFWRTWNAAHPRAARYIMIDSSPQFSRDYVAIIVKHCKREDLRVALQEARELEAYWQETHLEEATVEELWTAYEREKLLMDSLSLKFGTHCLPVSLIGFGASDLNQKMESFLHALRLEVPTHGHLESFIQSLVSIVSDYGTEYGLGARACAESLHTITSASWQVLASSCALLHFLAFSWAV